MTLWKTHVEDIKGSLIVTYRRTHYRMFLSNPPPYDDTGCWQPTIHGSVKMTLRKMRLEFPAGFCGKRHDDNWAAHQYSPSGDIWKKDMEDTGSCL
jgi:hypothetical protein